MCVLVKSVRKVVCRIFLNVYESGRLSVNNNVKL
jgi:hypothetical protein